MCDNKNRRAKDVSSAEPQCYFCPGYDFSCSNCMVQHILDKISELEKWKLWVKTRIDYAVNAEQERKENREVLRDLLDLAESIIIGRIPDREEFDRYIRKFTELKEKLDSKKEYIASLNDPKAFEAVNLGVLKRERKAPGGENVVEVNNPMSSRSGTKTSTDSKLHEPIDPCISCPDNDICEEECHLSKDAKKEYQKYEKAMREEEKDDYDNDAIRYKLSKMGIIIGRSDIYGIEETENYVKLQFQGTIEIKKEVLK